MNQTTVRELLTKLDGRGLACDMPEQVNPDLLLMFGIGLDTPLFYERELVLNRALHQQIGILKSHVKDALRLQKSYPHGVLLTNAMKALDIAESLVFTSFTANLTIEEVHD